MSNIYRYRYWRPEHGETFEDGRIVSIDWEDAADAATHAAEYDHDRRDGNECSWPVDYCVQEIDETGGPIGPVEMYEVERDFDPVFSAALVPKTPSTRKHTLTENDDCVAYCAACAENHRRGLNPDGTPKEP